MDYFAFAVDTARNQFLPLFTKDCAHGQHGPLVNGDPVFEGEAVNIPHYCADCGVCVEETSYTREAWEKLQERRA